MRRLYFVVLLLVLGLLVACGADSAEPVADVSDVANPTEAPPAEPTDVPTAEPTEPPAPTNTVAAAPTDVPTEEPAPEQPLGANIHGYSNVLYTQDDADLIGQTNRVQFLQVYASW